MTITEPTPAEIADDIEKAAAILEGNGHNKGWLYDRDQNAGGTPAKDCRVCVYGALNIAVWGKPQWSGKDDHSARTTAAGNAVAAHLNMTPNEVAEGWNDDPKRQKRQVVKALRDTAAGLRAGVAA